MWLLFCPVARGCACFARVNPGLLAQRLMTNCVVVVSSCHAMVPEPFQCYVADVVCVLMCLWQLCHCQRSDEKKKPKEEKRKEVQVEVKKEEVVKPPTSADIMKKLEKQAKK